MSNVGKELRPAQFGVPKQNPREISPVTNPDRFGQVYDNQKDLTSGEAPSSAQVDRSHSQSDVDSSPNAQHHTLGNRRSQASPGNHIHDGTTSPKLGLMEPDPDNPGKFRPALTCAADATSIRAMLHNFINFRDV